MNNLEKYGAAVFVKQAMFKSLLRRGKPALSSLDDIISGRAARLSGRTPRSPNAASKSLADKEKFLNQQIDDHLARHQSRIGTKATNPYSSSGGEYTYPSGTESQFFKELGSMNPIRHDGSHIYNSRASIIKRQMDGFRSQYAKQFADYVPIRQRPIMKDWVEPGLGLAGLGGGGYWLNSRNK